MPDPNAGESKNSFIARCIPMVMDEGKPRDQAIAICQSRWRKKMQGGKQKFRDDRLSNVDHGKNMNG
jgi:hypothetical protein